MYVTYNKHHQSYNNSKKEKLPRANMDWFSWLSRSNLDPSLICEYALAFAHNELQKEDLSYFNHEFLQSMGISVAKHRLEILKLARKEIGGGGGGGGGGGTKKLSKIIVSSLNKTRKGIAKCISKLIFHEAVSIKRLPEPPTTTTLYDQEQRKGTMMLTTGKCKEEEEKPVLRTRRVAKSGPLDGRVVREKMMMGEDHRSLKLSGPLDRNLQERLVLTYRSPIPSSAPPYYRSPNLSGPLNKRPPSPRVYAADYGRNLGGGGGGFDDQRLWSSLFQDLKPT